ncbi:SIMPL domain-containing protein [Candidatus Cyrtobacter comes]|uniref:SIMPL domain-containing protein n=1 Tax=Candidatus Cyrtobacter comes TaxID=675776 RepID=A0ABU5L7X4_9RICK|nr:SIMPL domain-containing protein [Candidatus Cyrtobacter comes]MDZ5762233.1 SIMPL domain-containing protein [Candidatus Cyrtobacter comes]
MAYKERSGPGFLSFALIAITVLALVYIGSSIKHLRPDSVRKVSVKGLAERVVLADLAMWSIPLSIVNNDLEIAKKEMEASIMKVSEYLIQYGLDDNDITPGVMRIYDQKAQRYYDPNNKAPRFSVDYSMNIKTSKVAEVSRASNNLNDLVKSGVSISYDGYNVSSPRYLFTKLNDIKPQMLGDAIKEAYKAAEEIADNSGDIVWKLVSATQGSFSIYSHQITQGGSGNNGVFYAARYSADSSAQDSSDESRFINKIVRVVVSASYSLREKGHN